MLDTIAVGGASVQKKKVGRAFAISGASGQVSEALD